jgi:nucleotide-binding universal stress UspA family protein
MARQPAGSQVFRSILCPVDFSAHSRAVLRYAAALARRSSCHLVVVYVNDPLLAIAAATRSDARALVHASEHDLRKFVISVTASRPMNVTLVTTAGKPAREIVNVAERHGCDLIIMGYRGVGGASKLLFGSTTEGVVRATSVPVLAIPPARRRIKRPDTNRSRLKRVS